MGIGDLFNAFADTFVAISQQRVENQRAEREMKMRELAFQQQTEQARLMMDFRKLESEREAKQQEMAGQREQQRIDLATQQQQMALEEKKYEAKRQGRMDVFGIAEKKAEFGLKERELELQKETRDISLKREERLIGEGRSREDRLIEQERQNNINEILRERQQAIGYGEDTSAFDQRLSELGWQPQEIDAGPGYSPQGPTMEPGAAAPAGGRTRGRGAGAKPELPEETEARKIKAKREIAEGRVDIAAAEAEQRKLGIYITPEQERQNQQLAADAKLAWDMNDHAVRMVTAGGATKFYKRHALGDSDITGKVIVEDPDLIGEAATGLLKSRQRGNVVNPEILAAYKDQVIGSGVEAFRQLNPGGGPITTSDVILNPDSAKAMKVAKNLGLAKQAYEVMAGKPIDVEGIPDESMIKDEGPDLVAASMAQLYHETRPQGIRAPGRGTDMPGVLPDGVEITRRGDPVRLMNAARNFKDYMKSLEGQELPPGAIAALQQMAGDIAVNPAIPRDVYRSLLPAFTEHGIAVPKPGEGQMTLPTESSEAPGGPGLFGAVQGALQRAKAGPGKASKPAPGKTTGMAGGGMLGALTMAALGSQQDVTDANLSINKIAKAAGREGKVQALKDQETAIQQAYVGATKEEKAKILATWTKQRGFIVARDRDFPLAALKKIDDVVGWKAPKGK